jgi:hypothetical protein
MYPHGSLKRARTFHEHATWLSLNITGRFKMELPISLDVCARFGPEFFISDKTPYGGSVEYRTDPRPSTQRLKTRTLHSPHFYLVYILYIIRVLHVLRVSVLTTPFQLFRSLITTTKKIAAQKMDQ